MPSDEGSTLCVYPGRGLPPARQEFNDVAKGEAAFAKAKGKAILWKCRPPGEGLGWIKLKEKDAEPEPSKDAKAEKK